MAVRTKAELKALFETFDKPSEVDFGDLIDSLVGVLESTISTIMLEFTADSIGTELNNTAIGWVMIEGGDTAGVAIVKEPGAPGRNIYLIKNGTASTGLKITADVGSGDPNVFFNHEITDQIFLPPGETAVLIDTGNLWYNLLSENFAFISKEFDPAGGILALDDSAAIWIHTGTGTGATIHNPGGGGRKTLIIKNSAAAPVQIKTVGGGVDFVTWQATEKFDLQTGQSAILIDDGTSWQVIFYSGQPTRIMTNGTTVIGASTTATLAILSCQSDQVPTAAIFPTTDTAGLRIVNERIELAHTSGLSWVIEKTGGGANEFSLLCRNNNAISSRTVRWVIYSLSNNSSG